MLLTTELASCVDGSKSEIGPSKERKSGRGDRRRRSPIGVALGVAARHRGGYPTRGSRRAQPSNSPKIFRPSAPSCEQNSGARRVGFHALPGPSRLVFVGGRELSPPGAPARP